MSSIFCCFPCFRRSAPCRQEDAFPLGRIPPIFQAKVLKKCDWKSYFRLQQTCRQLQEVVERNNTIRGISLPPSISNSRELGRICYSIGDWRVEVGSRLSYGLCFDTLHFDGDTFNEFGFKEFCQSMKYGRYSCETVKIYDSIGKTNLTKEQCTELFNTLKPTNVYMECDNRNVYDAVFHARSIKDVTIRAELDLDNILPLFIDLVVSIENVSLHVKGTAEWTDIPLICELVEFLRKCQSSNLRQFFLQLEYNGSDIFFDKLTEALCTMKPKLLHLENMGRYQELSAWPFSNSRRIRHVTLDRRHIMLWSYPSPPWR